MPHQVMQRRGPRLDDLTGRQKAAVLIMALGAEASEPITSGLSPEELEGISYEIACFDEVPMELAEAVLREWEQTEEAAFSLSEGGVDYAREILERALGPQKAAVVLKRIESQLRESGFQNLRNADPQQLTSVLRNEHPQTIALILAHLDSVLVADVLKQLDPALGSDVTYRLARMEKVLPEVLRIIEQSLGTEAALSLSQDMSSAGGPAAVAEVLNLVNASLEKELLEGIERYDGDLCEEIKSLMFVFEDIIKLDEKALQRVLREVDSKELAMALKAASAELKERITGTMSRRAVGALTEEMEFLGPVRLRDVEAAQSEIVKHVRALEEAGEIVIGGANDDFVE